MAVAAAEKKESISVDEQFLKDYVGRGGKAQVIESGKEIDKENVDEFLRQQTAPASTTAEKKTKLQQRAEQRGAADEERLQREKEREEQLQAKEAEDKRQEQLRQSQSTLKQTQQSANDSLKRVGDSITPLLDRIAGLHTVGSISLLLVILTILIFTVVQVNAQGDTRIKLWWAMLTGNAHLVGRAQVGGSASGNFGQTGQPGVTPPTSGTPPVNPSPPALSSPSLNGSFRNPPLAGF
jgi:Fe2+ transport system protein B